MTSRIFALAKNPPPRPLAALLEELREFTPPAKSPELQALGKARHVAGLEQIAAMKALGELLAQVREAEALGQRYASHADIAAAEQLVADCGSKLAHARELESEAGLVWRREYAKALSAAVLPARHGLHALVSELDAALILFRHLAHEAAAVDVGQNWILRQAPTLLENITVIREHLALDAKL